MLGPSGCGKTTTLRMIAGLRDPVRGRDPARGQDVSKVPPYRRNVNTVFQAYALFPHMTVWDNIAFGPRSRKVDEKEIAKRVDEMLEIVRLARVREAQAHPAVRRAAAARRARPRARELPERVAARRTARRARPQAAPGDADRAQAHPARGRDHVHLRDPRSGRGAHDERPDRGDEPGLGRADRRARGDLPPPAVGVRRRLHRPGEPLDGHRRVGQQPTRAVVGSSRQRGRARRSTATACAPAKRCSSWCGPSGCG